MSRPRTSPPLQSSKKRKVNDLESTEEDEASVNRKTVYGPRAHTKCYSVVVLPENNLAAVAAVNYDHPLHNIPANQRQLTPQPQRQAHTRTPSHPQSQSQSQPQSRFQSQPPPQQSPLRPQPQSQPQQSPRSIATPVAVPGSADTKKSTPKPAAKRTQIPGDGTLGTSTSSGTPSPHPTAVVNGSASTLGSSPRVAPSPALHAIAVAGTNAASISSPHGPHPPAQSAIQPQQGQPQPQAQAVPQARPPFAQQAKGFAPPLQTYMNMGAAGMNPELYKQLAAQAQGRNAKGGVVGQSTQQQIYYMMQAQAAQAQAQAHAQGQVQPVNLTPAQLQTQARYAAQMA
ncbi:hypothetical protein EDB86DRAFT_2825728 [Lactarius hatsudake]|nr:hypothetical protein EDB86DRAFT_2825728 [Lactarius hatsudake]